MFISWRVNLKENIFYFTYFGKEQEIKLLVKSYRLNGRTPQLKRQYR